jgi:hypothetical protein
LELGIDTDWYWCGWVYCTAPMPSDKPYSVVLAKRVGNTLEYQVHIERTDNNQGVLTGNMGPIGPQGTPLAVVTKPGFTADAWHFVEFWHDKTSRTLSIDFDRSGTPGTGSTGTAGLKGTSPLFLGHDNYTPAPSYHRGLIDNLGLYSPVPPEAIRDGLFGGITPY